MGQDNFLQENYKLLQYIFQIENTSKVSSWKSIGFSGESFENKTTSDSKFPPTLINYCPLPVIKFNGDCLINNNNDASLGSVNLYISYTLD